MYHILLPLTGVDITITELHHDLAAFLALVDVTIGATLKLSPLYLPFETQVHRTPFFGLCIVLMVTPVPSSPSSSDFSTVFVIVPVLPLLRLVANSTTLSPENC